MAGGLMGARRLQGTVLRVAVTSLVALVCAPGAYAEPANPLDANGRLGAGVANRAAAKLVLSNQDALDQTVATLRTVRTGRMTVAGASALVARTRAQLDAARQATLAAYTTLPAPLAVRTLSSFDRAAAGLDLVDPQVSTASAGVGAPDECMAFDANFEAGGTVGTQIGSVINSLSNTAAGFEYTVESLPESTDNLGPDASAVPIDVVDDAVGGVPEPDEGGCVGVTVNVPAPGRLPTTQSCNPGVPPKCCPPTDCSPDPPPDVPPDPCGSEGCVTVEKRSPRNCYNNLFYAPTEERTARFGATAVGYHESYCDALPNHVVTRVHRICLQSRRDVAPGFPVPDWNSRRCVPKSYTGPASRSTWVRWYCRKTRDWRMKASMKVYVDGKRQPGPPGAVSNESTLNCPG